MYLEAEVTTEKNNEKRLKVENNVEKLPGVSKKKYYGL